MSSVMDISLSLIKVGERARKDLGDLDALAASIDALGLLQPIGIDSNYKLIFGERRLRAFEKLGREKIPARIVHVPSLLLAEHAENEIRKDFTPSERVAIAKAIEDEIGNRRGQRTDLKSEEQGELIGGGLVENFPQVTGQKTRQIAAETAGFGNETTYRQAKAVVEKAEPELIEAMDKGEVAIPTADKLATEYKVSPELAAQFAATNGGGGLKAYAEGVGYATSSITAYRQAATVFNVENSSNGEVLDRETLIGKSNHDR